MQTTIQLPESVYRQGERIAQVKGISVDELIVEILERELASAPQNTGVRRRVHLPLISSSEPGSLNLSEFDFDDLLA